MKQRLYFKIYLAVLASVVIFAVATALLWRTLDDREERIGGRFDTIGQLIENSLPQAGAPATEQQQALERITQHMHLSVMILSADGQVLAQVGETRKHAPKFQVPLSGGRTAWIRPPPRGKQGGKQGEEPSMAWAFITGLLILLGAVAVTALPIARRLTRRLERLNEGVEQWGQGDLSARAPVQGNDEVAKLATSFNRAAGKIEELVSTNKMMLANASHELRTPLTRIRMNVEMLKIDANDARLFKRKTEIEQDISELDEMIEGILLSSRLEAYDKDATQMPLESVDLLALVAEECAHYKDVEVSGESVTVQGNPKLLRRLVRNVVENAFKYGLPPVDVRVLANSSIMGAHAEIHFTDHGQGVKLDDPNALFEPFVRAHRSQNGAGLGLSLVKKIAERHGGGAKIISPKNTAMHLVVWL